MSRLKNRLLATLAVCLLGGAASAQTADDWIVVKAGNAFTFEAPADIQAVPVQGVDSFVGEYRSPRFSLNFDYGLYSNDLRELRADPRYEIETVEIDGRQAIIVTGPGDGGDCAFITATYLVVRDRTALEMGGCSNGYAGVVQMHRLFRSIRFTG